MNRMKKLASLLLALVMLFAMTATAETVENETTAHTYNVYQIFSGTQTVIEGDTKLGDVKWGTGVNGDAILTALKADARFVEGEANIFADCTTAADVAAVLSNYPDKSPVANAFANVVAENLSGTTAATIDANTTTVDLAAGYYLLVDTTAVDGTSDARNTALLQVTKDGAVKIEKKYDVPSVDKTIEDEGEAADVMIGDSVEFVLTGTLPTNYADYETYTYIFHDTLSAGLTYNNDAKVYVKNGDAETEITEGFVVTSNGTALTISTVDLKKVTTDATIDATSKIVVRYTAELNSEAVIGGEGNPNEVYLKYSNDPNFDGEGDSEDEPTGKTPEDKVVVFTYELDVTKVDGANDEAKLADAEFILLNADKTKIAKIANGKFVGWADYSEGTVYTEEYTVKSDANGQFSIAGLDAGTYYLKETVAPAGYNLLQDPIQFIITATITDNEEVQTLDKIEITVGEDTAGGNVADGSVAMTVENNAGTELPETGGVGTTMLYVVGGLLVAGAVVVMISRKKAEEK